MALDTTFTLLANFPETVEYRTASGHYGRVKDSIEVFGHSRQTENEQSHNKPAIPRFTGVPDVWRLQPFTDKDYLSTSMTREFQVWIYRINVERMLGKRLTESEFADYYDNELQAYKAKDPIQGQTIRDFGSLFRAKGSHTNFAGTDNMANYIAQERTDYDTPKFQNIVTGRWVGMVEGTKFHVINASKPYTHYHPFTHPHLFDEPLSTAREFIPGTNIIKRDNLRKSYNDFADKVVMPVILPMSDFATIQGQVIIPSDEAPLRKFAR